MGTQGKYMAEAGLRAGKVLAPQQWAQQVSSNDGACADNGCALARLQHKLTSQGGKAAGNRHTAHATCMACAAH
jgi:hypothetical protein